MKCVALLFLWALSPCSFAIAQPRANSGFRTLQIDAGKVTGEIHDFQGLNGQPAPAMAGLPDLIKQYKELRTSLVRTHDFMGPTDVDARFKFDDNYLTSLIPDHTQREGVVESGNKSTVFPDSTADPEKPESYNFGTTDKVLADIHASGASIYYRIGRSYGSNTEPPVDFDKYASAVKHIAMHYNQGWANGFHYNIRYWEFWNEPDGVFWTGTPEQFYQLYEKVAVALKSTDATLKVGGPSIANPIPFSPYREGFLDYCKAHNVPLDFYSWHTYQNHSSDPYDASRLAKRIRDLLDAHGFRKTESILSEWNLTSDFTVARMDELRSAHNAAFIASVMSYLQDAPLDRAIFYRGDASWMGLFELQGKYYKTAYAFKALGQMLDTPRRLAVTGTDTFGFAALAGRSADEKTVQVLISNYAIPASFTPRPAPPSRELPLRTDIVYRDNAGYNLAIDNLPWGKAAFTIQRYLISSTRNLELVEEKTASGSSLKLSNPLATDSIELIVLHGK